MVAHNYVALLCRIVPGIWRTSRLHHSEEHKILYPYRRFRFSSYYAASSMEVANLKTFTWPWVFKFAASILLEKWKQRYKYRIVCSFEWCSSLVRQTPESILHRQEGGGVVMCHPVQCSVARYDSYGACRQSSCPIGSVAYCWAYPVSRSYGNNKVWRPYFHFVFHFCATLSLLLSVIELVLRDCRAKFCSESCLRLRAQT